MAKELQLNSAAVKKEANVKSVCQSLKKKLQEKLPRKLKTVLKASNLCYSERG